MSDDDDFYVDDEPTDDLFRYWRAGYGQADTSSSNDTYLLDMPCTDVGGGECRIVEMLHYGLPTGILWCEAHGHTAGIVERAA